MDLGRIQPVPLPINLTTKPRACVSSANLNYPFLGMGIKISAVTSKPNLVKIIRKVWFSNTASLQYHGGTLGRCKILNLPQSQFNPNRKPGIGASQWLLVTLLCSGGSEMALDWVGIKMSCFGPAVPHFMSPLIISTNLLPPPSSLFFSFLSFFSPLERNSS